MATTEQHSRIRRKHSHGEQNSVSTDIISDLPDAVLCHILSFLLTKDSVRTSVLGKRWRYLWAYVPNLDFDNEKLVLINSVMLLRKVQSISSFGLLHDTDCDACQLETWLTFAVTRNVQKLSLRFRSQDALPRCLFTSKTLVYLSLSTRGVIPRGVVCLPRLKKLYLIDVQFEADESLPHLLSGCPVLEELTISLFKSMLYCDVSSPTIKSFELDYSIPNDLGRRSERLEINTPALECLKIVDSSYEHIKVGVLNSLIEAEISFYYHYNKDKSLLGFVHRLCNVRCLKLDLSSCSEIAGSLLSPWTMSFCNLTELELTADCRFLSKFLESADNLEILSFTEFGLAIGGWSELPQQVPTCLLSNLRFINLVDVQGEYHEFEIIRYLLRNAKVLEKMTIEYPECLASDEEINMLKKISLFRRGSSSCEVAFDQIR